jgi:hypothetical protein
LGNFTGAAYIKKFKGLMVTIDRIDSGGKALWGGPSADASGSLTDRFQRALRAGTELLRGGFGDFIKPTGLLSVEGL